MSTLETATNLTAENFTTGSPEAINKTTQAIPIPAESSDDPLFGTPDSNAVQDQQEETSQEVPTEAVEEKPQEEAEEQPQDEVAEIPEDIKAIKEKHGDDLDKYIDWYVQHKYGIDLANASQSLAYLQNFQQTQAREAQLGELKQEWGDDFEDNFNAVKEYFETNIPENERATYDNVRGAKMIFALIQQERQRQGIQPKRNPRPPANPKAVRQGPGARAQYDFVEAEVEAMPTSEYVKIAQAYTEAWMKGRVLRKSR